MPTALETVSTLMGSVGGGPDHPATLVRRAIDIFLDDRQLALYNECYVPSSPLQVVPAGLVPWKLLAWPPPQRPRAPPGCSLDGGTYKKLFDLMDETMEQHVNASAALQPLAREGHTMRVIEDIRTQLNEIVDTACGAAKDSARRDALQYPAPAPRITPDDERAFEHDGLALGLQISDARRMALRFTLDAAVTILSSCRSLRDLQSAVFALPHWARAGVFVTEMRLQTRAMQRQAQVCALFNRLPNLHRLSLDAGLNNDARPRLPAARVGYAEFDLATRTHWAEGTTRRTLAALGFERMHEVLFDNVGEHAWVVQLACGDANDRPTVVHFLWGRAGFDARVFLGSLRVRRLRGLIERDDAVVFSALAKSTLQHLVVSNVIRDSALRALARTASPALQVLEVVLHPGDREVTQHQRMLGYRGRRWKNCPRLRTLKLCVADTGAGYETPIGPVEVSAEEVRDFMLAIVSRILVLEVVNVDVPGWNF